MQQVIDILLSAPEPEYVPLETEATTTEQQVAEKTIIPERRVSCGDCARIRRRKRHKADGDGSRRLA